MGNYHLASLLKLEIIQLNYLSGLGKNLLHHLCLNIYLQKSIFYAQKTFLANEESQRYFKENRKYYKNKMKMMQLFFIKIWKNLKKNNNNIDYITCISFMTNIILLLDCFLEQKLKMVYLSNFSKLKKMCNYSIGKRH